MTKGQGETGNLLRHFPAIAIGDKASVGIYFLLESQFTQPSEVSEFMFYLRANLNSHKA
jgi:hypothetical protein